MYLLDIRVHTKLKLIQKIFYTGILYAKRHGIKFDYVQNNMTQHDKKNTTQHETWKQKVIGEIVTLLRCQNKRVIPLLNMLDLSSMRKPLFTKHLISRVGFVPVSNPFATFIPSSGVCRT